MHLKQTLVVNDVAFVHKNSGDYFALLSYAQCIISEQCPDVGKHWLQNRHDFMQKLGELFLTGRCQVFDFEVRVTVRIYWTWVAKDPVPVLASITES